VRIDAGKVLTLLDRSLDAQELRLVDLRARIERLERALRPGSRPTSRRTS
jgi:hypothetical protein